MDEVAGQIGTYLVSLGLPGIVIIGLALAVYRIFNLYHESQEKRIEDSLRSLATMNEMKASIDSLKNSVDMLSRAH